MIETAAQKQPSKMIAPHNILCMMVMKFALFVCSFSTSESHKLGEGGCHSKHPHVPKCVFLWYQALQIWELSRGQSMQYVPSQLHDVMYIGSISNF